MKLHRRGEDFSLQTVPKSSRTRRILDVGNLIFGMPTALVFFGTGAVLGSAFGWINLITGAAIACALVIAIAFVLVDFAARTGLDSDLMSIVAGFGKRGSAITSLIYSANFVILFSLEDDIIASALTGLFPEIPKMVALVGVAVLFVAVTWFGVASLNYVMGVSLPIFLILLGASLSRTADSPAIELSPVAPSLTGVLYCTGVLMAFVVNATVGADIGRFLSPNRRRTGVVVISVIPQVSSFFGAVLLGYWIFTKTGLSDPGSAFVLLIGSAGLILVAASQFRINAINLYAGSLSLSNFGRRAFGIAPGRHAWMCALAAVGTVLAVLGVYQNILSILVFESVFVCAWVGVLVAVIWTQRLAHDRTKWDPNSAPQFDGLGIASLFLGLTVGVPASLLGNDMLKGVAPILAFVSAMVLPVIVARASKDLAAGVAIQNFRSVSRKKTVLVPSQPSGERASRAHLGIMEDS